MKRTSKRTMSLLPCAAAGLLAAGAAQAGSYTADFSSEPAGAALGGSALIEEGVLKLTITEGSQQGTWIIDDLDGGAAVTGFTARFKLLIGGGTGADGFSFNFASDLPSSFGEEGGGSGLTIAFDVYDNGGGEAPAIDIKKGGVTIASKKGIGGLFRTGTFQQVVVTVDNDGSLDLSVGGTVVYSNLYGAFDPTPGQFGFGARTGGSHDNHWVDDVNITTSTIVPTHPIVLSATPTDLDVTPAAIATVKIQDKTAAVNASTIKMKFNGADVTPNVSKVGDTTTVAYDAPGLLPPLSVNTVELTFSDNANPPVSQTVAYGFTVAKYIGIPATAKVTPDTNKRGFIWRVFANTADQNNSNAKTEAALNGQLMAADGTPLPNLADPYAQGIALDIATPPTPDNAPIQFEIDSVINMSPNAGNYGTFQPDDQMPGLPASDGVNNGIAGEVVTYLELPAGATTMAVASDDGFRTTSGRIMDAFDAILLGQFEGGRGVAETAFTFVVEEAGVYAFRTTYENGGGDGNLEWYTIKPDGTKVLVNDTANGGLKAYRVTTTTTPPYVKSVSPEPVPRQANVPAQSLGIVLSDGGTALDDSSIKVKVDGKDVTPTKSRDGKVVTVTYGFTGLQIPTDKHTAELTYKNVGGSYSRTLSWTFYNIKRIEGLPAPTIMENFDSYAEDTQPTGWTAWNFTARCVEGRDITSQTSESYENWVLVDVNNIVSIDGGRPYNMRAGETYNGVTVQNANPPGGVWPDWLMSGNVLYAESDSRCNTSDLSPGLEGQTQFITTKAYNLSAFKGVVITLSSIYEQNQDSIGSMEYSIDGGTTWKPIAYFLEPPDIKLREDGTVDAVRTFNDANTDTSSWPDPVDPAIRRGDKYGDCLGAPISNALDLFVVPRINDDQVEGKRVEIYRLPGANKADVRLRFGAMGTDSWYFAIDNLAFYDVAEAAAPGSLSIVLAGSNVTLSWTGSGTLQEASSITGPWTASGNQANPQTTAATGAAKYFRLSQ